MCGLLWERRGHCDWTVPECAPSPLREKECELPLRPDTGSLRNGDASTATGPSLSGSLSSRTLLRCRTFSSLATSDTLTIPPAAIPRLFNNRSHSATVFFCVQSFTTASIAVRFSNLVVDVAKRESPTNSGVCIASQIAFHCRSVTAQICTAPSAASNVLQGVNSGCLFPDRVDGRPTRNSGRKLISAVVPTSNSATSIRSAKP